MRRLLSYIVLPLLLMCSCAATSYEAPENFNITVSEVGPGWSATSVNTAIFRASSVVTHADTQYVAYYDPEGFLTLACRKLGHDSLPDGSWTIHRTQYQGKVSDAHNVASIGVDGSGRLHVSFNQHGDPLHYARAVAPGSLELGDLEPMTAYDEDDVTYPEFYPLQGGNLMFAYRSGKSGNGNLVLKRYDTATGLWEPLQSNLIDGEGLRNAYWQLHVDGAGTIHLSWVWRETPDVATNHDVCYARSVDGGLTWQRSDSTAYTLPITMASAEVACAVPQGSELINQTSMTADVDGHPYIATYWRDASSTVPQYRLVWHDGSQWHSERVGERYTSFSLAGRGTKMIPIARPRLVSNGREAYYIFRDAERSSRVSMAYTPQLGSKQWEMVDLTDFSVDAWEPTVDNALWASRGRLDIYVQPSHQGDGERTSNNTRPSPVSILTVERKP